MTIRVTEFTSHVFICQQPPIALTDGIYHTHKIHLLARTIDCQVGINIGFNNSVLLAVVEKSVKISIPLVVAFFYMIIVALAVLAGKIVEDGKTVAVGDATPVFVAHRCPFYWGTSGHIHSNKFLDPGFPVGKAHQH